MIEFIIDVIGGLLEAIIGAVSDWPHKRRRRR